MLWSHSLDFKHKAVLSGASYVFLNVTFGLCMDDWETNQCVLTDTYCILYWTLWNRRVCSMQLHPTHTAICQNHCHLPFIIGRVSLFWWFLLLWHTCYRKTGASFFPQAAGGWACQPLLLGTFPGSLFLLQMSCTIQLQSHLTYCPLHTGG